MSKKFAIVYVAMLMTFLLVGITIGVWYKPELLPKILTIALLYCIMVALDQIYIRLIAPRLSLSAKINFCIRALLGLAVIGIFYLLSPSTGYIPTFYTFVSWLVVISLTKEI
jgi:hypothetical protein